MAEYCTASDLDIWGVSKDALEDESITEKVRPAIEAASDLVDSYLRSRYKLPLTSWGKDITRAAAVIAAYDLMSGRGFRPDDEGDRHLLERYEATIKWLEQIAKGSVAPNVVEGGGAGTPGSSSIGRAAVLSNSSRGWQQNDPNDQSGPFAGRR